MNNAIREIIETIPKDHIFDSHYIISQLIKKYTDIYHTFSSSIDADSDKTLIVHGNIGQIISTFENDLVKKQNNLSWSENIHGNSSECAAWLKR
jgi:hypothetical protein